MKAQEIFDWPQWFKADVTLEEIQSSTDLAGIDWDLVIWWNTDFAEASRAVHNQSVDASVAGDPIPASITAAMSGPNGEEWFNKIAARPPWTEFRCADHLEQALSHILKVNQSVRPSSFMVYDASRGIWVGEGNDFGRDGNVRTIGSVIDEVINNFSSALNRAADLLLILGDLCAPDPGPKPAANANQTIKNAYNVAEQARKRVLDKVKNTHEMSKSIFRGKYNPIKTLLKGRLATDITAWDSDTRWLVLSDGVLDLDEVYKTGNVHLYDFSPKHMMTMALEVGLSDSLRNAGDSEWDRGVRKVVPDPQVRDYLQKRFGAALLGRPGLGGKSMVWQYGVGDTAKSTIQECIAGSRGVFAPYAITSSSSALTKNGERTGATDRFKAYSRGKRFAIMSELDDSEQLAQGALKNMIGGESVEGTAKFANAVSYFFTATIFMASNHPPTFPPGDTAAATRIHVVPFTHKLWIRSKNPDEWEAAAPEHRADEGWTDMVLSDPRERAAILRWTIDGLIKFGRDGGIGRLPEAMIEASEEFSADADPVAKIVRSLLGEEPGYEDSPQLKIYSDTEWASEGFLEKDGVSVKEVETLIEIRANELGLVKPGDQLSRRWMNGAKRMLHEVGGAKKKVLLDGRKTGMAYSRMKLVMVMWEMG